MRHLFFCLLFSLVLVGDSLGRDKAVLVVGMELAYPPFEMAGKDGQPEGVSPDIARALGEFLHRKTEILNLPFDGLIPSLKTGKIDLIISSMTATEERARSLDFSEPYLSTGLCLLVGKQSSLGAAADCDQPGRTIAVKQGTTGHLFARRFKRAKVLVLDRETACVLEVVQGRADAFIYDQMSTFKNCQKNPQTTQAILTPFQEESWAIGLAKGQENLRKEVNAFLTAYREKGGFNQLGDHWLSEQKAEFKKLGIPFYF